MSLEARIGRMETASPPPRLVRIDAKDEADRAEQLERLILSSFAKPGPIEVEISMNGTMTRKQIDLLPFEDMLELLY